MTGWFNPDGWVDLVSQILLIIGALAIAIVPSAFAARNHRDIKEVVYQTKNAHSTNLRDDLDRAIVAIEALSKDFRGLRVDLAAEESRRRDHVAELRDEVQRKITEIKNKLGD